MNFDSIPTDTLRTLRDSAKRIAHRLAADHGDDPRTAAAWFAWRAYEAAVAQREAVGCR